MPNPVHKHIDTRMYIYIYIYIGEQFIVNFNFKQVRAHLFAHS